MRPRLPYQYAAAFMRAGHDKEKQKAALAGCPKHFREQVKTHIRAERDKLKHGISTYKKHFIADRTSEKDGDGKQAA